MYHLCEYLSADMHTACDRKVVSFPITYSWALLYHGRLLQYIDVNCFWRGCHLISLIITKSTITFPLSMCADVMKTFVWLFLIFFDLWWTHQIVKRLRPTGSFERFLIHMVLLPIIAVTISFQSPLLGSRQKAENKVIRELSIRFGNIENSKEKFTTNILLFHLPWLRIKSYTPIFGQVEL